MLPETVIIKFNAFEKRLEDMRKKKRKHIARK